MGAQLDGEAVEDLAPRWFAETVLETEEDGEDWLEYYFHDNYGGEAWLWDEKKAQKSTEEEIVEALEETAYGDRVDIHSTM